MKRNTLYIGLVLLLVGIIGRLYAAQYTHVTPDGILRDSLWLPIGTFLMLFGIFALFIWGTQNIFSYRRSR